MNKYKVLEVRDESDKVVLFVDDKGFNWDPGSEVTSVQVSNENAKKAISEKKLELTEGNLDE